ncbi:malonate decarboxylase holo-ACP synthase [Paenibacillus sp. 2KB_22]|uniref:malonate decarboxylase holo-ACP synthase n=1 Tax=Paenibacillus sp. 2KB_22 TaxID=3232978 RepID=UPI003F95D7EE
MDLKPHDLLKIDGIQDLVSFSEIPDWVFTSIENVPFVVVRRAFSLGDQIAVGVRGQTRNKRFAAFLPYDRVVSRITPEELVDESLWRKNLRIGSLPALQSLFHVSALMDSYGLIWGPTGSVGFELTTGLPTVTSESDLDLIIRTPSKLSLNIARGIVHRLRFVPSRVDVQLETIKGAISLVEYTQNRGNILLKSANGPSLVGVNDIWETD